VSDNSSNNAAMVDEVKKLKWPRFKGEPHWDCCFAHVLNLIVKAILKPFGTEWKTNQNDYNYSDNKDEEDAHQIELQFCFNLFI
jgi:hypothetical protein